MIGAVVGLLAKVGTYAAAVEGASVVAGVVREYAPKTKFGGMVAGAGDMITNVLDPLDFTGVRRRKEEKEAAKLMTAKQRERASAKKAAESARQAKKADAKLAATAKKLEKAQSEAAKNDARADKLFAAGKTAQAQALRDKAQQAERYAKLALRAGQEAQAAKDAKPDAAAAFAGQAVELAKLALNPPANAIVAINKEATDSGKALMASLVDAVNRPEEPDMDQLFAAMNQSDPGVWESSANDDYVDGMVAGEDIADYDPALLEMFNKPGAPTTGCGGGCGGCASGGACSGKLREVPDNFIGGDFDEYDDIGEGDEMFPGVEDDFMDDSFFIGAPVDTMGGVEAAKPRRVKDGLACCGTIATDDDDDT